MGATYRAQASTAGSSGSGNRICTFTPAVGDLLIILDPTSGNTNAAPTCSDNNADGLGAYTLIGTALFGSSANICSVFVRNALIGSATSTTVTVATGSNTAGVVGVIMVAGMSKVGAAAVRQSNFVANQSGTTPTATLPSAALTDNLTIAFLGSDDITPPSVPTGWTQRIKNSASSPNTENLTATRDTGFTGTSIAWGSSYSANFAVAALELDTTSTSPIAGTSASTGGQSGALAGAGALAGTSASTGGESGLLKGAGALAGTAAGTAGQSGALAAIGRLAGTAAGVAGQAGALQGLVDLAGTAAATSTATATLLGAGALAGIGAGVAGQSGNLVDTGVRSIAGTAAAVATATGVLLGAGALAGVAAARGGQRGTMQRQGLALPAAEVYATHEPDGRLSATHAPDSLVSATHVPDDLVYADHMQEG